MLRIVLLACSLLAFSLPVAAQDVGRAKVLGNDKDRTGKRFANRYTIECTKAGQFWNPGALNQRTRKVYIRAGVTALRVGVAATAGSIGEMSDGTRIRSWKTLSPRQGYNFGSPPRVVVQCQGAGTYYAHIEWRRKENPFLQDLLGGELGSN